MANLRRDNHYVPKLYLKQWSHDGFIPTYRLLVPNEKYPLWKEQSLKGIAFHQHLYTYLAGQEETDEFEKWLDQEFENPAQEAIERVVNERSLSPEHWKKLLRFAAAQDVRTPARLREFLGRQREILPSMLEDSVQRSVHMMERAVRGRGALPESKIYTDGFPMNFNRKGVGRQWVAQCRSHHRQAVMAMEHKASTDQDFRSSAEASVDDTPCTTGHIMANLG